MDEDARAALDRARKASRLLDSSIRVPGTRFRVGIDPILGIAPVGGDLIAMGLSLYPIFEAARLGAPPALLARMILNVLIDTSGGSVPVLGTVFDAAWKANERNVALLERHLEGRERGRTIEIEA